MRPTVWFPTDSGEPPRSLHEYWMWLRMWQAKPPTHSLPVSATKVSYDATCWNLFVYNNSIDAGCMRCATGRSSSGAEHFPASCSGRSEFGGVEGNSEWVSSQSSAEVQDGRALKEGRSAPPYAFLCDATSTGDSILLAAVAELPACGDAAVVALVAHGPTRCCGTFSQSSDGIIDAEATRVERCKLLRFPAQPIHLASGLLTAVMCLSISSSSADEPRRMMRTDQRRAHLRLASRPVGGLQGRFCSPGEPHGERQELLAHLLGS